MAMIIVSAIISAITAKIVATYYFKKIDGYVKEMCEMTEKSNQHTLAILHKLVKFQIMSIFHATFIGGLSNSAKH